ncbi:MAG: NADPH:quinone oxidoreductase family protein [Actinomycetota bacterium]
MRAWQVTDPTDPTNGLGIADVAEPDGELVVEVRRAGIGYPDLLMRRGEFQIPQEPPFVLGWEAAGEVVAAPADAAVAVGDRVATMTFGAFTERVSADPNTTFRIPEEMSFDQAAALPLNSFTALAAMRRGGVDGGDVVLVHGAAGGVGSSSVQLAKARGATVIAVVSTDEKARQATADGADHVAIGDDWVAAVRAAAPLGVDVIIDPVTGDRFRDSIRLLATEGRLLVIGFVGGSIPSVSVNKLLFNNTDVRGCSWSVLGSQPGGFPAAAAELSELATRGEIAPVVGETLPFEELPRALETLGARQAIGKLVLDTTA